MKNAFKKILNMLFGFFILIAFYFLSDFIVKFFNLALPSAILGLILFALSLIFGIIKESWIKNACDFLINNMAMFLVPFVGRLIVYKELLAKNWFLIFIVVFLTTSAVILIVGLFVEWGIKFLKIHKIKEAKEENYD